MFRVLVLLFPIYFLAMTLNLSHAITPEQKAIIQEHFEKVAMSCIKDNVITEDDVMKMRSRQVPSGPNAPCFMACILKNIGIMNDKGMIQKDSVLELAKTVFDNDEELKIIEDSLHTCSHVNTEAVTDNEKGCDRAIKAFKCMVDNSQFGFDW